MDTYSHWTAHCRFTNNLPLKHLNGFIYGSLTDISENASIRIFFFFFTRFMVLIFPLSPAFQGSSRPTLDISGQNTFETFFVKLYNFILCS